LSKKFYDTFGDDITNELVDWFNKVDATYRTELRELNELNFGRFDAKLEQRAAQRDAKLDQRIAEVKGALGMLERRLDARMAAFRHYRQAYSNVLDVFARVWQGLREGDLRRLPTYAAQRDHRARFCTGLVTVVRHLTGAWFRHRYGRRRLSVVAEALPPLRR